MFSFWRVGNVESTDYHLGSLVVCVLCFLLYMN